MKLQLLVSSAFTSQNQSCGQLCDALRWPSSQQQLHLARPDLHIVNGGVECRDQNCQLSRDLPSVHCRCGFWAHGNTVLSDPCPPNWFVPWDFPTFQLLRYQSQSDENWPSTQTPESAAPQLCFPPRVNRLDPATKLKGALHRNEMAQAYPLPPRAPWADPRLQVYIPRCWWNTWVVNWKWISQHMYINIHTICMYKYIYIPIYFICFYPTNLIWMLLVALHDFPAPPPLFSPLVPWWSFWFQMNCLAQEEGPLPKDIQDGLNLSPVFTRQRSQGEMLGKSTFRRVP